MSFRRLHQVVTYLLSAFGLFALSLGGELDAIAIGVLVAAYVGSLVAEGPILDDPRWVRGWTIGLMALLALQVLRGVAGAPLLPLGLEFIGALLVSRLYNRRSATEYQQAAALSILALIAGTVLSTQLSYAFAFLGFVIVTPWVLALGHLRAEIEGHYGEREAESPGGSGSGATRVARVLGSRRVIGPRFLLGTAALAVPLFLMTGVLFVAFPRVGLGFLTFGIRSGQRVAGFGSNIELGDFGVLRTDSTVVVRVTPPGLPEAPPPLAAIRLRGTSFDRYDGRTWTRDPGQRQRGTRRDGELYPVPHRMPQRRVDRPWRVVLDHLEEPVVFLPEGTVGLEIPVRTEAGFPVGREIRVAPGMDIRYADADGLGLRYTAWVSPEPPPPPPLSDVERAAYLEVPPGHARVAALARRWTAGAATDLERVRALVTRLRDGDYTYSLRTPEVGDRLPLEVFLFDARAGHCEYFSTSLAVMLRTLGIPARNVTGFLGGRWNSYGRYYSIRQGDAHSWVEAWVDGRWVTLDATPPSRDALGPADGLFTWAQQLVDALAIRWSQDVVGYDLRTQWGLARRLRGTFRWLAGTRARPEASSSSGARPERAMRLPAWGGPALLGIIVLAFVVVRLRRGPPRDRSGPLSPTAAEAVRLYRRLERALERRGQGRPAHRTPLEHADALRREGYGGAELVGRVTRRYMSARFGGEGLDGREASALRRELGSLPR
ncbi:MAG: transglutaminaseTgpA domain-containing protein [Sandaracinaceae bacterium]